MAVDMKSVIAAATWTLLVEKRVKKLTVKDIVETCHITRQSFYYHFEDIPGLLRWMLEKGMDQMLQEIRRQDGPEAGLRHFFMMSVSAMPYLRKTSESNYGAEIGQILREQGYRMFAQIVEEENLYQDRSRYELKLILRYHSLAILGILQEWTENDTENMDRIVHEVYLLLTGAVSPFPQQ